MHRMAEIVEVSTQTQLVDEDRADGAPSERTAYLANGEDVMVYRIAGPFFFGAAGSVATVLGEIGAAPRAFVLDLSAVPLADATAAQTLDGFLKKAKRSGAPLYIAGARPPVRRVLEANGLTEGRVIYADSVDEARTRALT
ncbi:MAG: sulfate transporter, partial [Hyphomicrobiales bacterium]|nr:sulfate transporter [Hyphomicrobiales bacterium]